MLLNVPVSSSAFAWLPHNAAASAQPIKRKCFIGTLLVWISPVCMHNLGRLEGAALFLPLPLGAAVAALEDRGGWGKSLRGLGRSEYAAAPPPQPSPAQAGEGAAAV